MSISDIVKGVSGQEFFGLSAEAVAGCDAGGALDLVVAARRFVCRAQALESRAIARLDEVRGRVRSVADELMPELRVSREAAVERVVLASALLTRMSCLLAAMEAGELDIGKARQAFEGTACLSDELVREADAVLAGRIGTKHPGNWRKAVTHVVHGIDPGGQRDRARAARERRKVELIHQPDSMASLWAYLPAEVASAVYARVDGIARKLHTRDEVRTMDQLRADVLAELLLGKHDGLPGVAAQVFLHIPIGTALGVSEEGCELVGHGPIPGEIGREIMSSPGSVWRKVVTDPVRGTVRDVGRTRYRPAAALDELVRVRDRTCRAPGCNRPAQRCDNDHCQAWTNNGETRDCNLCCLCRWHHVLKDEPGWNFHFNPDTAELTVTTPTGRSYTTTPPTLTPPPPPATSAKNDDDGDQPPPF